MAIVKRYLAALKHIVPSELEYWLEEEHNAGYALQDLGQGGLLYFQFLEQKPEKCAYVVDLSSLPRALYMKSLIEKGWEPLGRSMNCYIWRQYYDEKRPENFADRACIRKHCLRLGALMAVMALLFLVLAILYFRMIYLMRQNSTQGFVFPWQYLCLGLLHLPFFAYCAWAARGLLTDAAKLKAQLALHQELSAPRSVKADALSDADEEALAERIKGND